MSGTAIGLWSHVFAGQRGFRRIFSGQRSHGDVLEKIKSRYLRLPERAEEAARCAEGESTAGREVYSCAHLLTRRRRVKDNATPLAALYVDGDGAKVAARIPGAHCNRRVLTRTGAILVGPLRAGRAEGGRGTQSPARLCDGSGPLRMGPHAAPACAWDTQPQIR